MKTMKECKRTAVMILLASFILICFSILQGAITLSQAQMDMQTPPKPVKAKAGFTKTGVHPGGEITLFVNMTIEKDWHVFGKNPDIGKIKPLTVDISAPKEITASAAQLDKPEKLFLESIQKKAFVYHKKVVAMTTLKVSSSAKLKRYFLEAKILYQACSKNLCLLPQTITLKIPLEVVDKNVKIFDPSILLEE